MPNLTFQLDEAALKQATAAAMADTLSPEIKEKLIKEAIEALLKVGTDSWNRGTSKVSELFNQAVLEVAREEAKAMVENDSSISERVKELLRKTADKVLATDLDKLAQKMADAFVDSIRNR